MNDYSSLHFLQMKGMPVCKLYKVKTKFRLLNILGDDEHKKLGLGNFKNKNLKKGKKIIVYYTSIAFVELQKYT